jgi:hypothetical protein
LSTRAMPPAGLRGIAIKSSWSEAARGRFRLLF